MSILLALLLSLTSVSVLWQSPKCKDPDLLGYFVKGTKNITVCKENAQKRRTPLEVIIKHEYVHFVYDTVGSGFNPIPEPLLTDLVRKYFPPDEVLFVILYEKEYSKGEEFTARLLADLPDPIFVAWALKALYLKG